jgi:hypothetical protein
MLGYVATPFFFFFFLNNLNKELSVLHLKSWR